jgi:hypothetical protein
MQQVFIELSYVDYVLVPVDAGFLVEVIRLGLYGIHTVSRTVLNVHNVGEYLDKSFTGN